MVAGYDLSTELPAGAKARQLVNFMARDKKSDGTLSFVLDGPDGVEPVSGVPEALVLEVLQEMGAER